MKKILSYFCAILFPLLSFAQSNLTVVLNDGSELVGYISRQRVGEDFTFTTSRATIIIPESKINNLVDYDMSYDSLSDAWKTWADENDAVSGSGDNRSVTFTNIFTDSGKITDVRILERGAKVKYLELSPNSYTLSWDALAAIKCERRPKLLMSGINRKYKLNSGDEYEGQYVEEIPGETLSILLDNGIVQVLKTIDVATDTRVIVNPKQSLLEQSELIDIVQTVDGEAYRGVIFERNYFGFDDLDSAAKQRNTSEIQHDFLRIQLENGENKDIELQEIAEYRKEPNPSYKPFTDVVLQKGQFMVNRKTVEPISAQEVSNGVQVITDSDLVVISSSDAKDGISIESNFDNPSTAQQFKLLSINQTDDKKKKAAEHHTITYEQIVKSSIAPVKSDTSVNETTKIDFDVKASGLYVFYNPFTQQAICFSIK